MAHGFALRTRRVHEAIQRSPGIFGAPSSAQPARFRSVGQDAQRLHGARPGQPAEHLAVARTVRHAGPLQQAADRFEPGVHGVDIGQLAGRPEALGDGRGARPDARIHRLRVHQFGPHAGFAAQNVRRLLGRELRRRTGQRVDRVVVRGRPYVVQIVAGREDSAIALGGGVGQRIGPAPGLNHGIPRQIGAEDFVPPDHVLAVPLQDLQHALVEIRLQRQRVFQVVRLGEGLHLLGLAPRLAVDLVAAHVKKRVGEKAGHLPDEAIEEGVDRFAGGVEHRVEHTEVASDLERARAGGQLGISNQPA